MAVLAQYLGRPILMLLAPVLRLYLGSVCNLLGWSVQALCLSGYLAFEVAATGTITLTYLLAAIALLTLSGGSIWLKRRFPLLDRLW